MGTITWTSPQSSGGQAGEYNFGATYSVSSSLNTNQVFPAGSTLTVSTWASRKYVVSFEDAWSGSTAQLYYGDATGSASGKTSFIDWTIDDHNYYLPNKVRSITYTTTRDCSQFYAKASNQNDGDGHGGAINFRVKLTLSYTSWTITLSRNNTSAGTVSGAGTYAQGNRTVTATTNSGYRFVGWYSGNTLKSSSASYTFNLTADTSLEARWINIDIGNNHCLILKKSSSGSTNQTLLHNRFLYSSSKPLVVTNGSQVIRSGTIEKVRSDTTLFFVFMCCGYVNSLSGGFYFFIDGQAVANATTIFTSANSTVFGAEFVDGISAGSHTFQITASTQGNNTFTVPAWTNNVITISEQY